MNNTWGLVGYSNKTFGLCEKLSINFILLLIFDSASMTSSM